MWEVHAVCRMDTSASAVLATWVRTARSAMAAIPAPAGTQASAWTFRRVTKAAPSSASVHMVSPN
jgi:ABC-type transporter Mla MlaB component